MDAYACVNDKIIEVKDIDVLYPGKKVKRVLKQKGVQDDGFIILFEIINDELRQAQGFNYYRHNHTNYDFLIDWNDYEIIVKSLTKALIKLYPDWTEQISNWYKDKFQRI